MKLTKMEYEYPKDETDILLCPWAEPIGLPAVKVKTWAADNHDLLSDGIQCSSYRTVPRDFNFTKIE